MNAGSWIRANDFVAYARVEVAEGAEVFATVNGVPAAIARQLGQGGVLFLAGEFGAGLPESYDNEVRGRLQRVYPPVFNEAHGRVLLEAYRAYLGGQPQVATAGDVSYADEEPEFPDDVEVVAATNTAGDMIFLCANWTGGTAPITLRIDAATYDVARVEGRAILPDASVRALDAVPVELAPQEAVVVRVPRKG